MSYRVELAKTGRAGCKNAHCKKNEIKIAKGELRLGSWVATDKFESYSWKHWGCVTGAQIHNIRARLEDPENPGVYRWDYMDGLQGEEDNERLPPEMQEKVKRAILDGHVAAEDWRGEPEFNKAGASAKSTRRTPTQLAKLQEQREAAGEDGEHESPIKAKPAPKKRGRAKVASDEDEDGDEEAFEPVKKRAKKEKKVEEAEDQKPAKKARGKKVKQEDAESEDAKPAKTAQGKKVKSEDDEDMEAKPVKKTRGIKVKKETVDEADKDEDGIDSKSKPVAKKSRAKKAVKQEDDNDDDAKPVKKAKTKKAPATGARRSSRTNAAREVTDADDITMGEENPEEAGQDQSEEDDDFVKKEGKKKISQSIPPVKQQGLPLEAAQGKS